jgi:hypothetical protein
MDTQEAPVNGRLRGWVLDAWIAGRATANPRAALSTGLACCPVGSGG